MTKAERLARKICRAAWDETLARGGSRFQGFMLRTIERRLGLTDDAETDAALRFAVSQQWLTEEAVTMSSIRLTEAGRQMLKVRV